MVEFASNPVHIEKLPSHLRKFWYPISLQRDLLPGDIVGLHILGDPICLYRQKDGVAACIADRCAHRSAPLSIGKMTDGVLECKYHGWKYDSAGQVTEIPALLPGRKIPTNAKVHSYPLVEKYDMIWIWPGAVEEANAADIPNILPGANVPDSKFCDIYYSAFDLDIDHSLMVENLLDPAHLPFAHEGTISKRENARPLEMNVDLWNVAEWTHATNDSEGHEFNMLRGRFFDRRNSAMVFCPPCNILIKTEFSPTVQCKQFMSAPVRRRLIMQFIKQCIAYR